MDRLVERLGLLGDTTTPDDPAQALAVPQQPTPPTLDIDDLEALVGRVAEHDPGTPVAARLDPHGCRLHVGEPADPHVSAAGPTLAEAVTHLLGPTGPARHET